MARRFFRHPAMRKRRVGSIAAVVAENPCACRTPKSGNCLRHKDSDATFKESTAAKAYLWRMISNLAYFHRVLCIDQSKRGGPD